MRGMSRFCCLLNNNVLAYKISKIELNACKLLAQCGHKEQRPSVPFMHCQTMCPGELTDKASKIYQAAKARSGQEGACLITGRLRPKDNLFAGALKPPVEKVFN